MRLQSLELSGFKSFARKTTLFFGVPITAIVGPNGSGKSNTAESFRFALGEQSIKSLRGKRGEDLIWSGSTSIPRSSRASVVLTFDNSERTLPLDLDTVTIERVVHRDGVNEYVLNGSRVRHRDIAVLLAAANIGASGHHIISQGEADRILACSSRERRAMIEDALGLRVYHYKLSESLKKLAQTEENIRSVEALRREIAPHLTFLKKQVARLERARALARDLIALYRAYFSTVGVMLEERDGDLRARRGELAARAEALSEEREALTLPQDEYISDETSGREVSRIEVLLRGLRAEREGQNRELGRIEGVLEMLHTSHLRESAIETDEQSLRAIPFADLEELGAIVCAHIDALRGEEGLGALRDALARLEEVIAVYIAERRAGQSVRAASVALSSDERDRLALERERVVSVLYSLTEQEQLLVRELRACEEAGRLFRERLHEQERVIRNLDALRDALTSEERTLAERAIELKRDVLEFKREQGEAAVLLGREVLEYASLALARRESGTDPTCEVRRAEQERARRDIERLRIRLEEAGSAESVEALKEYEATMARDAYLERELKDLALSRQSLENLMDTLRVELGRRFQDGLEKINTQFQEFFSLLFGGGRAGVVLSVRVGRSDSASPEEENENSGGGGVVPDGTEEDESGEIGLEVDVVLPHKRVKGLEQLSGGERALTSIALVFAISQVHPPPFLILDETDAALDEANSRRYGDMIERLAERSQLILITHNRETMSRAGVLYGVTMGSDGVSQLLSVRLDEANAAAEKKS